MADEQQIKSKQRVREQGEVFTAEREVNAMLDLVKAETERIDSRFLEPACGNGNFMVKILERKLAVVEARMKTHNFEDWRCNATQALSSIYGIDIMMDNVHECQQRMMGIICDWFARVNKNKPVESDLKKTWEYILRRNVLWGDALNMCEPGGTAVNGILQGDEDKYRPIVFSHWAFVGMSVIRRDYKLSEMLNSSCAPRPQRGPQMEMNFEDRQNDDEDEKYCFREFPSIKYDKLYTQE